MSGSQSIATDPPFASIARPRALKVLAVLGIVVAALSLVASLLSAGYGASAYLASNAARARILRDAPVALPMSRADQPVLLSVAVEQPVGDKGLDAPHRAMTISSLQQRIEMTPEQSRQLDALLASVGQELLQGVPATPDAVLEAVGDHYGLLATNDADAASPFYFQTPAGRAEIYPDRALFTRHNTLMPMRFSAGRNRNESGHPVLLRQDIEALIALAQQSCRLGPSRLNSLSNAQVQALRTLLADPHQQLVALNQNGDTTTIGIESCSLLRDGYCSVMFAGGPVLLSPEGRIILRGDGGDIPAVSTAACVLLIVEGVLSAALAVFLLLVSIRLQRRTRPSLQPLFWYAAVKPILAVGAGLALGWTIASYAVNVQRTPAPPIAYAAAIALAVIGCVYSIVLLAVSRLRSVRQFLHPR